MTVADDLPTIRATYAAHLANIGSTVTLTAVTKSTGALGESLETEGADTEIDARIVMVKNEYQTKRAGFVQQGDYMVFMEFGSTIVKGDILTVRGDRCRVVEKSEENLRIRETYLCAIES